MKPTTCRYCGGDIEKKNATGWTSTEDDRGTRCGDSPTGKHAPDRT